MKKRAKKLWTEALRSGDYAQGKFRLHFRDPRKAPVQDEFCCLGVLCEVAVNEGVIEPGKWNSTTGRVGYGAEGAINDAVLPPAVVEWAFTKHELRGQGAGARLQDPRMGDKAASAWNDNESKTFAEIADLVEEHL